MPQQTLPIRTRGVLVKLLARSASQPRHIIGPYSAYLDTGASVTVVDPGVLRNLNLDAVAVSSLHVLGRDSESHHDVYELEVALADAEPHWIPLAILAGPIYPLGTIAALGRDFLSQFRFTYDGPKQRVQLSW